MSLDSLTLVPCESKFYGTSRSVGVLKTCLRLGLGVGEENYNKLIFVTPSIGKEIMKILGYSP